MGKRVGLQAFMNASGIITGFQGVAVVALVLAASGCGSVDNPSGCNPQCEPGQDFCIDLNTGLRVNNDCTPYCPPGVTCDASGNPVDPGNPTDPVDPGNPGNPGNPVGPGDPTDPGTPTTPNGRPLGVCECSGALAIEGDSDGDCILDEVENSNGISDPGQIDTDSDGVNDGCEDKNGDGAINGDDTDPRNPDTDADGLEDGQEDANRNGLIDVGETSGSSSDSDGDGVDDGVEDANQDGEVDPWVDVDGDGCFTAGVDTAGETDPSDSDSDDDGILDRTEDANRNGVCDPTETCAFVVDTDCDGIGDGLEDADGDGFQDPGDDVRPGETNPLDRDSDGDGIEDGVEDADQNGRWDRANETNPRSADTDGDGLSDGEEDRNRNGVVDMFVDVNGDGCYTPFGENPDQPGESNPRAADSDVDGIRDNLEDVNQDGECTYGTLSDPLNPNGDGIPGFEETCSFVADTDCDGINDGVEDATRNGVRDEGELDPRNPDSDFDGLPDGCPPNSSCEASNGEDQNGDGSLDPGETNARSADTDRDGLLDGCEINFVGGPTDPLDEDTDGDGERDGEEDANQNCQVDEGETDPRETNPPPAPGTEDRIRFDVCSAQNVKRLTFAESIRLDYRLAFEVERNPDNGAEAEYTSTPIGYDGDGNGFEPLNTDDVPVGHVFQSPAGVIVDPQTSQPINRDVYGFIVAREDGRALDVILDEIRDRFIDDFGSGFQETASVTARPAHDDLPAARAQRAEREYEFAFSAVESAVRTRNLLLRTYFDTTSLLDASVFENVATPDLAIPSSDEVYGSVSCSGDGADLCYAGYSVSLAAVQRPDQLGVNGEPITLLVLALTPDDREGTDLNVAVNRLFPEKVIRLEDLTGGSAVARFAAETGTACEREQQTLAKADVLWVVDDSRSMQQIIDKLQQAASATQTVFTANSNIVDYRLAMTTTNPSRGIRQICEEGCGPDGLTKEGQPCDNNAIVPTNAGGVLGCINICPENCSSSCGNDGGTCNGELCFDGCTPRSDLASQIADDAMSFPLPGGGGTFYYEDSLYMDCRSQSLSGGLDSCGNPDFISEFRPFYESGNEPLLANAGFIGADIDAECSDLTSALLAPVDLNFDTTQGVDCASDPLECCDRLTDVCSHGPTVLASQMCDLIRAMGGKPQIIGGVPDANSQGRRAHSAPELGSLQARRVLQDALPAVPEDLAGRGQLRLNCTSGEPNCPSECLPGQTFPAEEGGSCDVDAQCGPRERCEAGSCIGFCDIVPVLTVFLSDEEDYFFKDECVAPNATIDPSSLDFVQRASGDADRRQLASEFRYADRDPDNPDQAASSPDPRTVEELSDIPGDYCDQFFTAGNDTLPTRYDPNFAPDLRRFFTDNTVRWRDALADDQCAPGADSCAADPCPLAASEGVCGQAQITVCPEGGDCAAQDACQWNPDAMSCTSICQVYNELDTADEARTACIADPACGWDPSQVTAGGGPGSACGYAYPLNDCQACKRLRRRQQSAGGFGSGPMRLVGLGELGPVYAISRNRGNPGAPTGDACEGGAVTWGRGDGSAYRDLAIDTLGRVQDVCADSYQTFVQDIVRDIVSRSAPYPLEGFPISSTIRVGIGRDTDGNGSLEFAEVPRSNTSGFTFDPTTNSLGFKSDPIDGVCGTSSCSADGVIEQSEVRFALDAPNVPRPGDVIYVSYRFWEPVPCEEECGDGETCVRALCPDETGTGQSCDVDDDCEGLNEICQDDQCVLDCTPGDTIDRCITPPCGVCETFNPSTGGCIPIADTCSCVENPDEVIFCEDQSSCPAGFTCLEDSCICTPVGTCASELGDLIENGGLLPDAASCSELEACCDEVAMAAEVCAGLEQGACDTEPACAFADGQCTSAEPLCCPPGNSFVCSQDPESTFFFTDCAPGDCTCEFDAIDDQGQPFDCSQDSDCFLGCDGFVAPNCPGGCVANGGVCVNAPGSDGPNEQFQPRVCDEDNGMCICNPEFFFCDPNTPIGCDCSPRPF
ncbi:MAG: hypothetical protein AAGJ56_02700 [Myxococcota bacterium]